MVKRRLTGWSTRGRPFSPKEFASSHLKKITKVSYSNYLQELGRQYKKKKLRKLLGK